MFNSTIRIISIFELLLSIQLQTIQCTTETKSIILRTDRSINNTWIGFYLKNMDLLSCNTTIINIEITDSVNYNKTWITYTNTYNSTFYAFHPIQSQLFTPPISIRITTITQNIILNNIITSLIPNHSYQVESNICPYNHESLVTLYVKSRATEHSEYFLCSLVL